MKYTHNVAPRYTCGSPALVDEKTAQQVANEEARTYIAIMAGRYGESDERAKAKAQGLTGIVWVTKARRGHTDFHDCITGECGIVKNGEKIYQGITDIATFGHLPHVQNLDYRKGVKPAPLPPVPVLPHTKGLRLETGHPVTADVKVVEGDLVRFVTPGGRCMFEVRAGKDGRSLEVRGVETCKVDGVLYSETLLVQPCAWNSVNITTNRYTDK